MVLIDLESAPGSGTGDGQVDTVTVHGSGGSDLISIGAAGTTIGISGVPASTAILHADPTDVLAVNGTSATTSSMPRDSPPLRSRSRLMAAPATTC